MRASGIRVVSPARTRTDFTVTALAARIAAIATGYMLHDIAASMSWGRIGDFMSIGTCR